MNSTEITEGNMIPTGIYVPKHTSLRRPIRLMGISFVFYMTWVWIVSGMPLTILAKMLNMSEFGFGILGGLMTGTQISQLLGSYVVERYGHRKLMVILGGLMHRGIWLLAAMLPIFAGYGNWTWQVLLLLACFSYTGASFIGPGSASWIADLVPGRLQGRFFGQRMQLGLIASMVVLIGASYILDKAEAGGVAAIKFALISIFMFASIAGMLEYVLYMFVPDPPRGKNTSTVSLWKILWKPLSDKEFRYYLGLYCTLIASAVFMGLFTFLFMFDVIKLSNVRITILLVVTPNLVNAVCYPFWGRVTDRVGYKPALAIGGIAYLFYACWFLMATPAHWVGAYVFGIIAFCFTGALDTGTAVLMYTKISGQGKTDLGSSYPAVSGVICAIGGAISAVVAGALASWIGKDWHGSVAGHPLTYHSILFMVMIAMRLVALVFLVGINNLQHSSATNTIKVIAEELKNTVFKVMRLLRFSSSVSANKAIH
ncbi:MAG: MFS transporter [Phycisphaerae bacterium]|jgi:MFS family permease